MKILSACSRVIAISVLLVLLSGADVGAQEPGALRLLDWRPVSQLVVKKTNITKPKFPVIDIHNHLGRLNNEDKILREMEKAGVISVASMDGHSRNQMGVAYQFD